mmetsp:Transcript_26278/g.78382  ORF Transcript_26278/g.78382 Transcript_26278/m.78382 type:complete len:153 (+) Transcript_26278:582-1040(+)
MVRLSLSAGADSAEGAVGAAAVAEGAASTGAASPAAGLSTELAVAAAAVLAVGGAAAAAEWSAARWSGAVSILAVVPSNLATEAVAETAGKEGVEEATDGDSVAIAADDAGGSCSLSDVVALFETALSRAGSTAAVVGGSSANADGADKRPE